MLTRMIGEAFAGIAAGGFFFLPAAIAMATFLPTKRGLGMLLSLATSLATSTLLALILSPTLPLITATDWLCLTLSLWAGSLTGYALATSSWWKADSAIEERAIFPAIGAALVLLVMWHLVPHHTYGVDRIRLFAFLVGGIASTSLLNWLSEKLWQLATHKKPAKL